MKPITVLIAEDHILIREVWQLFLETDPRFKVVGCTSSGEETVELTVNLQPDIVLMDINLKGMDGLQATARIVELCPNTKVVGLSMHTEISYVKKMMKLGAMGYMTKNSAAEELFKSILEAYNNRKYICDEIRQELSLRFAEGGERRKSTTLSLREMEIIDHIKQGCSSKEIALRLNLSARTVDQHRYKILKKLNVNNTAALINEVNKGNGISI
jgi:DNA-binding NarL/FixJ family response regulator